MRALVVMLGLTGFVVWGVPAGAQVAPTVSVADATVDEDGGPAVVTVSLSEPAAQPLSVKYRTVDGVATAAGGDYTAALGGITFQPGQQQKDVQLSIADDSDPEGDEQFELRLTRVRGDVTLGDASAAITIVDDDDNVIVSVFGPNLSEGDGTAEFSIRQFNIAVGDTEVYMVDYATVEETATGEDFVARTGTVVFDGSTFNKKVRIPVVDDTMPEPTETFRLVLSNPRNMVIDPMRPSAPATILDND